MTNPRKSLEHDLKHALAALPRTAPRNYQERRLFIRALVNDLSALKYSVHSLKEINEPVIKNLVQLWKKRGNTSQTIQVKLSRLRVLGCQTIPSLASLDLGSSSALRQKKQGSQDKHWQDIEPVELKIYARLQYEFGLKKTEAFAFPYHLFTNNHLLIPRAMAYNNHDRLIPIETEAQKKCYQAALTLEKLTVRETLILRLRYNHALLTAGVTHPETFRWQFIVWRYHQLLESGLHRLAAIQQLRTETGYRGNHQLNEVLKCHGAF